ncbi:hypothetical protein HanPSC8_Chr08g0307591 [Helianthus annuus]|nr:hypothetical protein HanPSC8_Chr08g0307591 [Helianthus annuus]
MPLHIMLLIKLVIALRTTSFRITFYFFFLPKNMDHTKIKAFIIPSKSCIFLT